MYNSLHIMNNNNLYNGFTGSGSTGPIFSVSYETYIPQECYSIYNIAV